MLFYSIKAIRIHRQHHEVINMKFVRFTKIICVRNSQCIMRTLNTLMHALMHALMMHHDARVDDASWYTRWCTRECVYGAICVNTHAMQFAWIRMQCSLRECVCDAVYVFAKSIKPSLPNSNDCYRFQIIMLVET